MKFKDVKKWLPFLLIGLPLLWLGLYFWAWMAKVGCPATPLGDCILSAFGNWGADVVTLRWMDTTLAAGVLALIAAGSIFLNSTIERRAAQDAAAEREKREYVGNIRMAQMQFRYIAYMNVGRIQGAPLAEEFAKLDAKLHVLAVNDEKLAGILLLMAARARAVARNLIAEIDDEESERHRQRIRTQHFCEVAYHYLYDPNRFLAKDWKRRKTQVPKGTRSIMKWDEVTDSDRSRAQKYITFRS